MVNCGFGLVFNNPDPMQRNVNSFEAENAQHNLFLLVNLVPKVIELISRQHADQKYAMVLQKLFEIICNARAEQTYKRNNALLTTFRHRGGMDSLINNCASEYEIEPFSSTRFLGKRLITDTRDYALKNLEEKVLHIVCKYNTQLSSIDGFKFNSSKVYYILNKHNYS